MRVLMFQPRFAALVESGAKRQTIRLAARCRPGCTLSLRRWAELPYRSRHILLGTATCTEVCGIVIRTDGICDAHGDPMLPAEEAALAAADGFADWAEMCAWFEVRYGLPLYAEVIKWQQLEGGPA